MVNQLKLGQNGRSNSLFKSSVQIQEKKSDTLLSQIPKDSSTSEFASLVDEKSIVLKTKKTTATIENKNPNKKEKLLATEKSSKKTFPIASKRKNTPLPKSSLKGSGFDIDDFPTMSRN